MSKYDRERKKEREREREKSRRAMRDKIERDVCCGEEKDLLRGGGRRR